MRRFRPYIIGAVIAAICTLSIPLSAQNLPAQIQVFWNALRQGGYSFSILASNASAYHNFGTTLGTGGYGFRDNAGTMQVKNSGGSWANIIFSGGSASFSDVTSTSWFRGPTGCGTIVYSFTGRTTTGLCSSAANTLDAYAGGTQATQWSTTFFKSFLPSYVTNAGSADPRGFVSDQYSNDNNGAYLMMRHAAGTDGSPAALPSTNPILSSVVSAGYTSTGWHSNAHMDVIADGTVSGDRLPTRFEWYVATDQATSLIKRAMMLDSDNELQLFAVTGTNPALIWETDGVGYIGLGDAQGLKRPSGISAKDYLAAGNLSAQSGQFRMANNGGIKSRDGANSTDYDLLYLDSNNVSTYGNVSVNSIVLTKMGTPASLTNGQWWVESDTGAVTGTVGRLKARLNGATVTIGDSNSDLCSSAAPTRSSGFGTNADASFATGSTACSFDMNIGTGGAPTSGVLTLPTAAHGWICQVHDATTIADNTYQSSYTASTATFTTTLAWSANDHLYANCGSF